LKPKAEFARHLHDPSPLLLATYGFDRRLIGKPIIYQYPPGAAGEAADGVERLTDGIEVDHDETYPY